MDISIRVCRSVKLNNNLITWRRTAHWESITFRYYVHGILIQTFHKSVTHRLMFLTSACISKHTNDKHWKRIGELLLQQKLSKCVYTALYEKQVLQE